MEKERIFNFLSFSESYQFYKNISLEFNQIDKVDGLRKAFASFNNFNSVYCLTNHPIFYTWLLIWLYKSIVKMIRNHD